MTPSWYDILDLDPSATTEEIRDAWRASITDLDPGDRRFRLRSQAAEVLLDEDRRRKYDAELAAEAAAESEDEVDTEGPVEESTSPSIGPPDETSVDENGPDGRSPDKGVTLDKNSDLDDDDADPGMDQPKATRWGGDERPRTVTLVALGVVAVVLLALTVASLTVQQEAAQADEAGNNAQAAAEQAVGPLLSYDYRSMEESRAAAVNFLTPEFAEEYEQFFAQLAINAPETQTVVEVSEVLGSGIVRADPDRVDVFLVFNRMRQNQAGPATFRDQATLIMKKVDGTWLVDEIVTENSDLESEEPDGQPPAPEQTTPEPGAPEPGAPESSQGAPSETPTGPATPAPSTSPQ